MSSVAHHSWNSIRTLHDLVAVEDLPPAPQITHRLVALLDSDDTPVPELTRMIARDPALTARLLQTANSSLFGGRHPVSTLHQAVTRLGFVQVLDLAFAMTMVAVFDHAEVPAIRRRQVWRHAAAVAAAARGLARRRRLDDVAALTAALLHDVGEFVLGLRLGDDYWTLQDRALRDGRSLTALEEETFGFDHATVGHHLLQSWGLPAPLSEAIVAHHAPLQTSSSVGISQVVAIADRLLDTPHAPADTTAHGFDLLDLLLPGWITPDEWADIAATITHEQQVLDAILLGGPR